MARPDINPLGYDLLALVREDVERYRLCLVKDSWRLFSSHENRLDVFRSLSANGGLYLRHLCSTFEIY